ncbi:MAG: hypothetical protein K2X81_00335 [Candidatus Obscuribacterales bacterium]|nr:hypothetical protein [Candidatus Obscuribacterales bacterium]
MQIGNKEQQVLLLILLLSAQSQLALAKSKAHRKLIPLTQMLEPKFDTSLVPQPSHFELGTTYTQIVYPKDPAKILHGESKVVDLSGKIKNDILRGQINEENRISSINTREYGIKPKFFVDLRKMEAKLAPDFAWQMEAQMKDAQRKLAGQVERQEKLMNKELKSRQPIADLPALPLSANANPDKGKALDAAIEKAKERERRNLHSVQPFEDALSRAKANLKTQLLIPNKQVSIPTLSEPQIAASAVRGGGGGGSGVGGSGKIDSSNAERQMAAELAKAKLTVPLPTTTTALKFPTPDQKSVSAIPSIPKTNVADPERLMAEQLAKAKLLPSPDEQVKAALMQANTAAQVRLNKAQPLLNAIMTSLRRLPSPDMPTGLSAGKALELDAKTAVEWDAWHAHFAELARDPILKAVNKAGNAAGADTVEITVRRDHHVTVRLSQKANTAFDQAIVAAYQSLDGNPALEFPSGSRRSSVSFLIDNKHADSGTPSVVKSQTSVGDKEIFRLRH